MKILGNPWVVGTLVSVALVVAAGQAFHLHWPHFSSVLLGDSHPSPPAVAVILAAPAQPPALVIQSDPATVVAMDRDYLAGHLAGWVNTPPRDPFLQDTPPVVAKPSAIKPVSQLRLKAIWRQDGVGMVAINDGIYGCGDIIEGYKVEKVEDGGVWVAIQGHKEYLIFDHMPANMLISHAGIRPLPEFHRTNAPPATAATND